MEEVKKQCADMDVQWDERQKTRAEETEAISKVPCWESCWKGEKCYSLRQAEFVILKSLRFCWVNTKPNRNFHHIVRNLPPFWVWNMKEG